MASGYFSTITCAGGCENLLPQKLVDRGRRYLWGHKNGCPKDGESARRKPATPPRSGVGVTKPGAVEHTSYERTQAMALVNLELAIERRNQLKREYRTLNEAVLAAATLVDSADAEIQKHVALIQCLRAFGPFGDGLTERVAALLVAIEKGEVFA